MSELQDYLNSMSSDITDDVAVSERFVDKNVNLLKFKIKSMSYDAKKEKWTNKIRQQNI